ncbi:MAG: BPL-N domain-containing protein [Methanobacterium formicicum]
MILVSAMSLVVGLPGDSDEINVNNSDNRVSTVKVLIFDGDGSMEESVAGLKACMDESNSMNLSGGIYFDYDTSSQINSNTLSGYDILIMPGGNSATYVQGTNIDDEAIKQFLNQGKGYLGICAGAYAASNSVDGDYSGWGLASQVNTIDVSFEGLVEITPTSSGSTLLNSSEISLYHLNGPVMYATGSSASSFASYSDNETGYQGYSAIMGESYGSGRVLLSGSHPELDPQNSQLLVQMILWATKKT